MDNVWHVPSDDGTGDVEIRPAIVMRTWQQQWAQKWTDENGTHIGVESDDPQVARVGIGDTPGAVLVSRFVTEWTEGDD